MARRPEAEEYGVRFAHEVPVAFRFMRNTESTPRLPKHIQPQYGQDIEPAGRYMLHAAPSFEPFGPWIEGEVIFGRPYVLEHVNTSSDKHGWKRRLSKAFRGKKGKSLSKAMVQAGYDGIVTIDDGRTSEIVDLTGLMREMYRPNPKKARSAVKFSRIHGGEYNVISGSELVGHISKIGGEWHCIGAGRFEGCGDVVKTYSEARRFFGSRRTRRNPEPLRLTWFDKPKAYEWIRENTPFDPDSSKGAGVSRDSRWVMHCFLTPENYLDLTSTTREDLLGRDKGHLIKEYADAMEEMLDEGDGQFPAPWLVIDWEDLEVIGHEGRHRAAAAWMLEIPAIPVVLVMRPKAYGLGGRGEPRDEEAVPLIQRLAEGGLARVTAQRYTPEDRLRLVWLEFVAPNGDYMQGGY